MRAATRAALTFLTAVAFAALGVAIWLQVAPVPPPVESGAFVGPPAPMFRVVTMIEANTLFGIVGPDTFDLIVPADLEFDFGPGVIEEKWR